MESCFCFVYAQHYIRLATLARDSNLSCLLCLSFETDATVGQSCTLFFPFSHNWTAPPGHMQTCCFDSNTSCRSEDLESIKSRTNHLGYTLSLRRGGLLCEPAGVSKDTHLCTLQTLSCSVAHLYLFGTQGAGFQPYLQPHGSAMRTFLSVNRAEYMPFRVPDSDGVFCVFTVCLSLFQGHCGQLAVLPTPVSLARDGYRHKQAVAAAFVRHANKSTLQGLLLLYPRDLSARYETSFQMRKSTSLEPRYGLCSHFRNTVAFKSFGICPATNSHGPTRLCARNLAYDHPPSNKVQPHELNWTKLNLGVSIASEVNKDHGQLRVMWQDKHDNRTFHRSSATSTMSTTVCTTI